MKDVRCRYCQQAFQPSAYRPQQTVCNQPACRFIDKFVWKVRGSGMPPKLRSGRFKATDKLIESLKSLSVMQSKKQVK